MDSCFQSAVGGTPPTAPVVPLIGHPQSGNPALGQQATKPGPWWYYMITQELRNIIAAAGLTPDALDLNQVLDALQVLFAAKISPAFSGTPTVPTPGAADNSLKIANTSWVQALLGTMVGSRPGHTYTTNDWVWVSKPDGYILQFGMAVSSVAGTTVSLPTNFANTDYQVIGADSGNQHGSFGTDSYALGNFKLYSGASYTARFFALGKV